MFEKTILELVQSVLNESVLTKVPKINTDCIHVTAYDQPPPTVGQFFILIYPESRVNYAEQRSEGPKNYVYDRIGFDIVCGARTRLAPTDRLAAYMNEEYTSLNLIKDIVITTISKTNSSNNMILLEYLKRNLKAYPKDVYDYLTNSVDIVDGFEYTGADAQPIPRLADYFSASDGKETLSERPAGHTYTCRFLSPSRIYGVQC
jgi:hypothetical protein